MTGSQSPPADTRPWHGPPRPSVRQLGNLPIWVLRPPARKSFNCVLVAGPDGLTMVNTGIDRACGEALRRTVADLVDRPVTTIIYPHHPTASCRGTSGVIDPDSARSGNVVVLAAGQRGGAGFRGVSPNLLVDQECILRLSGVTTRLFPVRTSGVDGLNVYLPRYRVALLADEPSMWKRPIGTRVTTPFARAANWFLRFPVEHLLGSHMLPLSGPEVHLVLNTYLNRGSGPPGPGEEP
ncbi:hypothetical protein GCM10029964_059950 [Kibdelosporangium lantanae]